MRPVWLASACQAWTTTLWTFDLQRKAYSQLGISFAPHPKIVVAVSPAPPASIEACAQGAFRLWKQALSCCVWWVGSLYPPLTAGSAVAQATCEMHAAGIWLGSNCRAVSPKKKRVESPVA